VTAAAISFLVGSIVLVLAAAPTLGRIHGDRVAAAPWWVWTGGLLGAAYVVSSIVLTPRLGAGTTVVLFIAGNLLGAMVLDEFGLLRLPEHHAGWQRILGAVLVLAGAVLVQRY
jgi:bacterial/archaeal transporter family-2 protein